MKESLKTYFNRCRCCLESFSEEENTSPITEFFAVQFFAFTRLELQTDTDLLSSHVCEFCHSELLRFSVFKKDLIEKQLKLYKLLQEHNQKQNEREQQIALALLNNKEEKKSIHEEYDEIDQIGSISENYSESSDSASDEEDQEEEEDEEVISAEELELPELKVEENVVAQEKSFICDYCSQHFRTKNGICNHIKSHIRKWASLQKIRKVNLDVEPNRILRYRCFCGLTFAKRSATIEHCTKKHGILKKCNFGCTNKTFETVFNWMRHIKNNHPEHVTECQQMIIANETNVWYTQIRESDYNANLFCNSCTYVGNTKEELLEHLKSKHSQERRLECQLCYKDFLNKITLKVHMRNMHNSFKGFKCKICFQEFKQIFQLRSHSMNIHGIRYKPYSCTGCGQRFVLLRELKKHEQTDCTLPLITKNNEEKDLKKSFICVCEKAFERQLQLKKHEIICKKRRETQMASPSTILTKEVYSCKTCRRIYVHKANLLRHQKNLCYNKK